MIGDQRHFPALLVVPAFACLENWAKSAGLAPAPKKGAISSGIPGSRSTWAGRSSVFWVTWPGTRGLRRLGLTQRGIHHRGGDPHTEPESETQGRARALRLLLSSGFMTRPTEVLTSS